MAVGRLLGHRVRFGHAAEVMAVGEGDETILAPRDTAATLADGRRVVGRSSAKTACSKQSDRHGIFPGNGIT